MNSAGDLPLPLPLYRIEQSEKSNHFNLVLLLHNQVSLGRRHQTRPVHSPPPFKLTTFFILFLIMGPSPYLLVSPIRLNCFLTGRCQLISFFSTPLQVRC
jgi:hypothetical protein